MPSNIKSSIVTNPEAKRFLDAFLENRAINREFYGRVSEDKFDFRMVDTPERKSDSPRESLAHQIDTQRDYMNGITTGILTFEAEYADLEELNKLNKTKLLEKLQEADEQLVKLLSDPGIANKKVKVPWSITPISALTSLEGLNSHEILHTGWNLALMDHLNMERFQTLKEMWG